MPKPPSSIKKPARFKEVFKEAQKVFADKATLLYSQAKTLEIGVTISKKQGGAVRRNRSRRLVREFFRLNQETIKPAEIVIVLRRPLPENYIETSQIMLKLLRKAGLVK